MLCAVYIVIVIVVKLVDRSAAPNHDLVNNHYFCAVDAHFYSRIYGGLKDDFERLIYSSRANKYL